MLIAPASNSARPLSRKLLRATAVAALACAACSSTRHIKVPILHPAEVNLSGAVALSSLDGDAGGALATLLEEKLLEADGRFQVIDRSHMGAVMNELKLSASDLAQENNAVKLGKLVTASAIISGDIDAKYREEPRHRTFRDSAGRETVITTWEGTATLRAHFKIIDVTTGRLLLARELESKKEWRHIPVAGALTAVLGGTPSDGPRPDREKLESEARAEVVARLVAAIAPRKEYGEVDFETDPAIPQLEGGIGWASRGEWKRAQDSFNDGVRAAENNPAISSKILAKGYLDAGLAYVFAGDYAAGLKLISKAYDLSQDTRMLDRLDYAKQLQTDADKFTAQTAPAAP